MTFVDYCRDPQKHERSKLVNDTRQTIERIFDLQADHDNIAVKLYASAPLCFLLLSDDRAMIEQYHFGKYTRGRDRTDRQILGKEMPIVEYGKEMAGPRAWPLRSPYLLLEDHFDFVWRRVALAAEDTDLDPDSGRGRAHALEISPSGSAFSE
jgi:hypothetical protein